MPAGSGQPSRRTTREGQSAITLIRRDVRPDLESQTHAAPRLGWRTSLPSGARERGGDGCRLAPVIPCLCAERYRHVAAASICAILTVG